MGQAADLQPVRRRHWRRITSTIAVVLTVLTGSAAITYRILAPAEVVTAATAGYPAAPTETPPGVIGTLAAAPLIVDGRLRVYATKRQIRADTPLNASTQRSPFWSYRRWPAQLTGVVVRGTTVVGRWSDGRLVAIDARTGLVAWRADGPVPDIDEYVGRRTGAATLYAPDGLLSVGRVLISRGGTRTIAVDFGTGRRLWSTAVPGGSCRTAEFTTAASQYAVADSCRADVPAPDVPAPAVPAVVFYDAESGHLEARWRPPSPAATGANIADVTPLGCRIGYSECAGLRAISTAGPTTGWLLHGRLPAPAPALNPPDAWLVNTPEHGDLAIGPATTSARQRDVVEWAARRADTGALVWTWSSGTASQSGQPQVVATQEGRVHLLIADYWLVTVDARSGVELSRFLFTYGRERVGYHTGYAYASNGLVLLERLAPDGEPVDADDKYYYIAQSVLLAAT